METIFGGITVKATRRTDRGRKKKFRRMKSCVHFGRLEQEACRSYGIASAASSGEMRTGSISA